MQITFRCLLFLLLVCATAHADKRVAVLPLESGKLLKSKQKKYYTTLIRQIAAEVFDGTGIAVINKENFEALLGADLSLEDCLGSCAVETGKNLKAHYVVTAELIRMDTKSTSHASAYRLILSAHDTKTAVSLRPERIKMNTLDDMERFIELKSPWLFRAILESAGPKGSDLAGRSKMVPRKNATASIHEGRRSFERPQRRSSVQNGRRATFNVERVEQDIKDTLMAWAETQRQNDFAAYQVLYARDFRGVKRTSRGVVKEYLRADWLADRKRMFKNGTRVFLRDFNFKSVKKNRVKVIAFQYWQSSNRRYADKGPKAFELVREWDEQSDASRWFIVSEQMLYSSKWNGELPD